MKFKIIFIVILICVGIGGYLILTQSGKEKIKNTNTTEKIVQNNTIKEEDNKMEIKVQIDTQEYIAYLEKNDTAKIFQK